MLGSLFKQVLSGTAGRETDVVRCVVVSATRQDEDAFWNSSPLGISWQMLFQGRTDVQLRVQFSNSKGLPEVYNEYLSNCPPGAAMVFVHDDVWLRDPDMFAKLDHAFREFDVVGLVGNDRCMDRQPAWIFTHIDEQGVFCREDAEHLRGQIRHGSLYLNDVEDYGETPAAVCLLDGVFIAVSASAIAKGRLRFDPIFRFHHYDSDFCRHAIANQYRVGVWPIELIHQSAGWYGGNDWLESFRVFVAKWG